MIHANGLIVILDSKGNLIDNYRDEKVFSENNVLDIVENVLSKPYDSSHIGNVYYFIDKYESGYIIISSDMTDIIKSYRVNILTTFIILLSIYGLLFFIIWALSFKVFNPIKEAFYKQKQFVSNASHELRTPITIISTNAEVLKQSGDSLWLQNIRNQTERMNSLVSDMLTLAKIDENRLPIKKEKFDLSQIVLSSALPFDAVAFEKGKMLMLDVTSDLQYVGDVQSVKNIVNILVDNAIKHAEKGGNIILSLKKESNKIILSVYNSGSQIPDDQSNKIFERLLSIFLRFL
jgi:signal transduction histidine kinase